MGIPNADAILGSLIPLLIFAILAVIARFYARRKRRQDLMIDDWLMIPALVLAYVLAIEMFYGIGTKSLGYPAPPMAMMEKRSDVMASDPIIVRARKLEYSFLCIFAPTNGMVKVSVLFLYRRLFVVNRNWKDPRSALFIVMIALTTMWAISYTFTFIFMCKGDFNVLFYDLLAVQEKCVDTFKVGYSFSISDFVSDVLILLIPIPFIWQLRLPLEKRLAVTLVFFLGVLSSAASLIRMLWMIWAYNVGMDPTFDEELLLTSELYWCLMEITLAIIAGCLPTLRGLIKSESVDSVFKNVRNIFSLRSTSSTSKLVSTEGSGKISTEREISISVKSESSELNGEKRVAPWM
ncbi:hypothetical protein CC78DRAFT_477090 [Lojkania enalia]|uniref:Rhodopsin domain-containing protein n=1 Tax=Lojkania enalia TaxID=147567 RepID=A0A9P4JYE9_9PLEO|nr:hypothetical protein CC78DRAFT_477090 [Didymosphaeria enalia]